MRLLVLADSAHDWPEDGDGRYELSTLVRRHRPDALISLGDFSAVHAAVMARAGAPFVAGVYGNHCTQDYLSEYAIADLVGDRAHPARRGVLALPRQREVSVLAVQGCVRYKSDRDDVLFTQAEYASAIDEIPAADLVITHCPPAGINDAQDAAHARILALRQWVDRHRPRWILHGHTYDSPQHSRHGDTEVFYVHGQAMVDLQF